ncbi:hypothetical protein RPC_3395 [Rhodopseudomonas palustris BisB18]|uniref:Uncharacterized protein n=1 Tax=Rhodopseudomonas palustris (strain BisB18) TaxID=316056 RepID=Q211K1_RHOPB
MSDGALCQRSTKSSISSTSACPARQSSMKLPVWISDIDRSPSHGVLDEFSRQRIERSQMFASSVEDLDFAVQAVPGVEPLAVLASPSSFTVNGAERLKTIEKARLRDRLGHEPLISQRP